MSPLTNHYHSESTRYVSDLIRRTNHQKPPKPKNQESFNSISFGHDSEFLRTNTNLDMFAIDNEMTAGVTPSVDWASMGESDLGMNSQSHSTIATDLVDNHKNWPYAFQSPFRVDRVDSGLGGSISLSQLEAVTDSTELVLPQSHCFVDGQYEVPYHQPKTDVMEAINALGSSTFSSSFVERMIEQTQNHEMQLPYDEAAFIPHNEAHSPWMSNNYWGSPVATHQHSATSHVSHSRAESSSTKRSVKATASNNDSQGNRRKTSQHTIFCTECDRNLGIIFIRGAFIPSNGQPANVVCDQCQIHCTSVCDSASEKKKRKRSETKLIDCEVCHSTLGHGGLAPHDSASEIKTEYVCSDCGDKYMFCSECGGGGKQRTGKWRPRELFEQGRRTCSLPHIRVGAAQVHYKVLKVQDLTSDVLQGIQDVFFDCLLSLYCVPSVMTNSKYENFESIKAEIEKLWLTSVLDVLTNNVLHGQKYITVAWIQKRHRNKGVGKPNPSKEVTPWLQRLGFSGIVAPISRTSDAENDQCFVAFSIAEWDTISQSIFLAQMAPRSVFLKTMDGYMDLIRHCIQAIHQDSDSSSKPTIIWCWTKPDHVRLQSIPTRLKFLPKLDYLESHPKVEPQTFERNDFEPLNDIGTMVYVSSVKTFVGKLQ